MKKSFLATAIAASLITPVAAANDNAGWVGIFGEYYNPDNNKPEPAGYLEDGNGVGVEAGWYVSEDWAVRAELAKNYLGRKKSDVRGLDVEDEGIRVGADVLYFLTDDQWYVFSGLKHQEIEGQRTLLDVGVGKHWELSERWQGITEVAAYQDLDESLLDFGLKLGIAYKFGFSNSDATKAATAAAAGGAAAAATSRDELNGAASEEYASAANDVSAASEAAAADASAAGAAALAAAAVLIDSDNDGIADDMDKCADTPATDKVSEDGCSVLTEQQVSMALNVNFANNSAQVANPNDAQFAEFAAFMKRFGKANAEVEGHSSAGGAASYNQKLSQQRAEAVRTLLIEQYGVDASRLTAKGYGESRLLDTSGTAAAAKRNRRIEVKVSATQVSAEQR